MQVLRDRLVINAKNGELKTIKTTIRKNSGNESGLIFVDFLFNRFLSSNVDNHLSYAVLNLSVA